MKDVKNILLALCFGMSAYSFVQVVRICNKLGHALDYISSSDSMEISESIIQTAVDNRVDQEVKDQASFIVKSVADATAKGIRSDGVNEIKKAVNTEVEHFLPDIKDKMRESISGISLDKAKKEVVDQVISEAKRDILKDIKYDAESKINDEVDDICDDLRDKAEDKFEEELEVITTRYKSRLDDVSDIYASFASKMAK